MFAPISIIIPTYNDAHYLQDCLKSILRQTLLPNEIIVVDDGSKTNSAKQVVDLDCFEPLNIRFLKIVNSGPSSARNKGFDVASSEYILFLDADDILDKKIIETYSNEIQNLSVDYFGILGLMKNFGRIINPSNRFIPEENINPNLIGRRGELQGQISCYLLRASYLKEVNCFNASLSHYEDFDLILRLFKLGKLRTIDNIALFKRFHDNSQSNKNYRRSFEGSKKFLDFARSNHLLSDNEVIIRLKENILSYGKQLFLQLKIVSSMEQFQKAFCNQKPIGFKEFCAYFISRLYYFFAKKSLPSSILSSKSNFSISVIIPTYNDEPFLMDTLASVFDQSILPDELIIIDDGSLENYAKDYLESFHSANLINIQLKKISNSGPSIARNKGAEMSTSDFLLFLDSDDLLLPDAIKNFHTQIEEFNFKNIWGVHGGISFLGSLKNYLPIPNLKLNQATLDQIGKNKKLEGLSSFLFSRESFNALNGFRDDLSHNEDFDIILRLSKTKTLITTQNVIVNIRKRKGSLSNRSAINSYLGVKKFLKIAAIENLLSEEEILIRIKENGLTFGKALFFQGRIHDSMKEFNKAFTHFPPMSFKEQFTHFVSLLYSKIIF